MDPLQIGTDEQFRILRECLYQHGFRESAVCELLGIDNLAYFEKVADSLETPATDPFSGLVRLFIAGLYLETEVAKRFYGEEVLQVMADLGILLTKAEDPAQLYSPIALYPTGGVYIASDRWNKPDRGPFSVALDVVYPAIVANTQRFLSYLPRTPCNSFLDLCCGTGAAALHAAEHFAEQSYAFDIAERSTIFAEFNARLNDIKNVTVATGDLYAPARGKTFDRIAVHPPYVPTLRQAWIYFDGGEDGEFIMRRVVGELPPVLRPGGLLYMLGTATDRKDAPLEQRVRGWLGENEKDFDIALIPIRFIDTEDFAAKNAIKSRTPEQDVADFKGLFERLEVESMVYCIILVQRKESDRPTFTVRRQKGPATAPTDLMKLLQWQTFVATPGFEEKLMHMRVRANPATSLIANHRLTPTGWELAEHILRTDRPFSMEAHTDEWAAFLVSLCDGQSTLQQHFEELKSQGALPAEGRADEFARAVAVLISGGFIEVELP